MENYNGKRFGKLLVTGFSHKDEKGKKYFNCICDCGNTKTVRLCSLKNGTKSCGCLHQDWGKRKTKHHIEGKTFGRLTVVKKSHRNESRAWLWECKCSCGKSTFVATGNLVRGITKSCGCLLREKSRERLKAIMSPDYPIGTYCKMDVYNSYKKRASTKDMQFSLTVEDFELMTSKPCHYCGKEPAQVRKIKGVQGEYVYNGIDRINNSKGYEHGNCVPCCGICNSMKYTLSVEDFIEHIKLILERFEYGTRSAS